MAKDIPLYGIFDPKHERYAEATEVRTLTETDPEVSRIMDTARGLEGLVRNAGVHACAVIMSSQPLLEVIPLWKRDDGSIITGWDYPSCEEVGLLKMDFLGLRNLTVIGDAWRTSRPTAASTSTSTLWSSPTRPPTSCSAAATPWACSSSMVVPCATCCAGCSPRGSRTSSRSTRCTARVRWA